MTRQKEKGHCNRCHQHFGYYLIHNGFNDTAYAYCDTCGMLSLFGGYSDNRIPTQLDQRLPLHRAITPDIEEYLAGCECGGHFTSDASPRCPRCLEVLSPIQCADWIESGVPVNRSFKARLLKRYRWHWQKNWNGVYSIVIEDRYVENNWKSTSGIKPNPPVPADR